MPSRDSPSGCTDRALTAHRDRLIAEIHAAFAGVTREGGVSISEAHAIDYDKSERACEKARTKDTDTAWSEVDIEKKDRGSGLAFMDPIGFRYHLPAYMCYRLQGDAPPFGPASDNIAAESAEFSLLRIHPLRNGGIGTPARGRSEILSDDQRRACARFLLFLDVLESQFAEEDPVRNAWYALLDPGEIAAARDMPRGSTR